MRCFVPALKRDNAAPAPRLVLINLYHTQSRSRPLFQTYIIEELGHASRHVPYLHARISNHTAATSPTNGSLRSKSSPFTFYSPLYIYLSFTVPRKTSAGRCIPSLSLLIQNSSRRKQVSILVRYARSTAVAALYLMAATSCLGDLDNDTDVNNDYCNNDNHPHTE